MDSDGVASFQPKFIWLKNFFYFFKTTSADIDLSDDIDNGDDIDNSDDID
jgi:hypothetical protein